MMNALKSPNDRLEKDLGKLTHNAVNVTST